MKKMKHPPLGGGSGGGKTPMAPPMPMPMQSQAQGLGGSAMDHQTQAMGFAGGGAVCYDKHCAAEGKK